jgi:hypothetical protein
VGIPKSVVWGIRNQVFALVTSVIFLIVAIEGAIELAFKPTFWQKTTWFLHDPYRIETLDRLFTYLKLDRLVDSNPDIISVGDSSGFHSLQSNVVNRYTRGLKYVNFNLGMNQAFDGHMATAEYMLQRANTIKYVVLYMFPFWLPEDEALTITANGRTLRDILVSTRSYVTPPSAGLSADAKYWAFEGRAYLGPSFDHKAFFEMKDTVRQDLGWLPEHDSRHDRISHRFPDGPDRRLWYKRLPFMEPSLFNATLSDFNRMVRGYGAKFVVAFNPLPARVVVPGDANAAARDRNLERFQAEHPEVVFLFPLVTTFGNEKFAAMNHISRDYSFVSSRRFGMALGRMIADPGSVPKYAASFNAPEAHPDITWTATGAAEQEMLDAAMAFFLYTATADDSYKSRISRRVLDLLARDRAFAFMMEDTRERISLLAKNHTKLDYDASQLTGTPIQVSGMTHCNRGATIQWVHVAGTMNFVYRSPEKELKAPINWPATSHIFIPTVVEDGVRKFDGYCPEPSDLPL